MKKSIKLISLLSLFVIGTAVFFIFAKKPADERPETVMVRVDQTGWKGIAWVDYGNSKIEKTDLDGYVKADDYISSSSKILGLIQKLNSEGYNVISQAESFNSTKTDRYETWVLTLK